MADEIRKVPDEVKENIEDAQESAVSDDAVETVAGGLPVIGLPPEYYIPVRRQY